MKKIILGYALFLLTIAMQAQEYTGDWKGTLQVQGTELPIIFHISAAEDQLTATMDSPQQGAYGIATDSCYIQEEQLIIKASRLMMTFTAKLQDGYLEGTFQQGMAQLPLKMERLTEPAPTKTRPQDPQPPFPYQQEEVLFANPSVNITLAGTLTLPKDQSITKVIIMISGSGPQDRNSEIMNHRPFLVWADHLTRQGIAVLRFDERGVGASEGDYGSATSADFASDVQAAVDFLLEYPILKDASIGLIGHSEGGMIAPMIQKVDFLVLLAAPGVPITELMYEQNVKVAEGQGIVDPVKTMFLDQQKNIFELVKNTGNLSTEAMRDTIFTFYEQRNGGVNLRDNPQVKQTVNQFSSPWMRYFLAYDPQPALRAVQVPVLAINGDKDTQVIAEQNIPGIQAAFEKGNNSQLTTKIFPGLNHLFQTAETGQANEYTQIEETVNPAVLEYVTDWILQLE
jgi:pimeloyl-ACP methyl ester carboxylesterase